MPYRDLEPLSKQITIVVGLTVVGFMAFGLLLSFYRNVLFEEHLRQIQEQNDDLASQIAGEKSDLEYYRSAQYKDKYAKENLGKLNRGEKVMVITQAPTPPPSSVSDDFTPSEQQTAAYEEILRQMPVYLHWELFLFERDKLDGLRRG